MKETQLSQPHAVVLLVNDGRNAEQLSAPLKGLQSGARVRAVPATTAVDKARDVLRRRQAG